MDKMSSLVKELRGELGYFDVADAKNQDVMPRYELFHSAKSICAQKVRVVLAHHNIPYVGHEINPLAGQNFLPSYVRLRILGCARIGAPLAKTYNGNTSLTTQGCDPCVVPTLIDWTNHEVIVDSKRICLYLDEPIIGPLKLRPVAISDDIDEELSYVDNFPNVQMLMAKSPDGKDTAGTKLGVHGVSFSRSRIEYAQQYLSKFPDDPALVEAYSAKIAKETQGAKQVFSTEAVNEAYEHAKAACRRLEDKLAHCGSTWLFGESVTMADIFWGVELLRLKNLGTASFWEDGSLPHVAQYVIAAEALPSIRTGVLEWKDALF